MILISDDQPKGQDKAQRAQETLAERRRQSKERHSDRELNPDAPQSNQQSRVRDANDDEKPDPSSVVQMEEVKGVDYDNE